MGPGSRRTSVTTIPWLRGRLGGGAAMNAAFVAFDFGLRLDHRDRQLTLTALQAAATAFCWALPAPYRSFAAFNVAVRAPAYVVPEVM